MEAKKRCTKCNQKYPATTKYFSWKKTGKNSLRSFCKQCQQKQSKQSFKRYYKANKERLCRYKKQYRQKYKYELRVKSKQYYNTLEGYIRTIWRCMLARCNNPKHKSYRYYGGRGIKIKFESFEDFFDYVVNKLKVDPRGMTIDRINNDGNYEPGNIRFVSRAENNRNQRRPGLKQTRQLGEYEH